MIFSWSISGKLLESVFAMAPRVRWIHSRSAGLDGVLFPALEQSPVPLTNGRGVFSESLGEFVVGAAIFFAKDFRRMLRSQEAGVWDQFDVQPIEGSTLGIVGYGDIGRAIARRAHAFGMKVLALRKRPEQSAGRSAGGRSFSARAKAGDAGPLRLHRRRRPADARNARHDRRAGTPRHEEDRGRDERRPRPGDRRGALVRALEESWIQGAALDVFDREPLPPGHPFYRLKNVLLSPHCADHTPEWLADAMRFFLGQFERFRNGEPLLNVVGKARGY